MNPADSGYRPIPSTGAALRAHRLDAGLSQAELAARLAIPAGDVARIERNDRTPEADLLEAFIAALELSADQGNELRKHLAAHPDRRPHPHSDAKADGAPKVWNVPGRNVRFTGRDEMLTGMRRRIAGGLRTVIIPVALRGLGGVGKTQLALEFAHRFKTDYDVVWWIDAEQLELIDLSLARLANEMGLAIIGNAPDDALQAREALRRGEPYARWLLVFDNAAEPDNLLRYLPDPGAGGHLLITSRDQAWAGVAATVEVDVYTRAESVARLTSVVRHITRQDAETIAELVGDLPLAVESAAAWLATTGTPASTYLEALQAETLRVLSLEQPRGYALPVAAVWSLSLKRLREQAPAAARLLELASFMSPDGIATELFYTPTAIGALRAVDEQVTDALAIGDLVRSIARLSLMRVDMNDLRVHRLVQEAVCAQLNGWESDATVHEVHRILFAARPEPEMIDDPAVWPRYALLWHHLAPSNAVLCDEEPVRELMIDRVRFLWNIGEYHRALQLARPILDRWTRRVEKLTDKPEDSALLHRQLLALQAQITAVLRAEGNLDEAYDLDAETLARQKELLTDDHPDTLETSIGMAADLRGRGEFDGALVMDQRTYADMLKILGPEHPRTLSAASNLALSSRLVGDITRARKLDTETLTIRRAVLGQYHPNTLWSLASCGLDLLAEGRYEESVPLLTESMKGLLDSLGQARPSTLRAATMLAWALGKAGRSDEAIELAEITTAHYTEKYQPHHPDALLCTMTLAAAISAKSMSRQDQGRKGHQAIRAAHLALAGLEARLGALHPSTLACANNTAIYERRAGHPTEARALLERAHEGLTRNLGRQHPNSCAASANLATCMAHAGQLDEAQSLERQALVDLTATIGADHPDTRAVAHNLAATLRALGRRREAHEFSPKGPRTRIELELPPTPL